MTSPYKQISDDTLITDAETFKTIGEYFEWNGVTYKFIKGGVIEEKNRDIMYFGDFIIYAPIEVGDEEIKTYWMYWLGKEQ
jgi:hypothetical protein